jgi:hypothetical protein
VLTARPSWGVIASVSDPARRRGGSKRLEFVPIDPAPALLIQRGMKNDKARPSLTLSVTGLPVSPSLRAHIGRRIARALVGVPAGPIAVHVALGDVNGPKGGADIRCTIDVRIPRARALHAEELADRDVVAFDRTADVITREIADRLVRRRENARHPKKYFAARRLL